MSGTYVLPTAYAPVTLWRYPNCGQWTHGPVVLGHDKRAPDNVNYCEEYRALRVAEWDAALAAAYARGREDAAKWHDSMALRHTTNQDKRLGRILTSHHLISAAMIRAGGA